MSERDLKLNDLRVTSDILKRLGKRLYLLRISLCDEKETKKLKENILKIGTTSASRIDEKEVILYSTFNHSIDCQDVEFAVGKVEQELTQFGTFKSLFEYVQEFENAAKTFEKQKKLLSNKRDEMVELKISLQAEREQVQPSVIQEACKDESLKQKSEFSENLSYLRHLLTQKVESKRDYYEHLFQETNEKTEEFERQIRMQAHADNQTFSTWLLKFQISKRQEVIEIDRKEKELERQKAEEERTKQAAAILIQAFWRGTMVRKHLGPFKIKKKKKGKKGKKKTKK